MYLDNNNKNKYVLDIETDGLNPTVIWCCVVKSLETGDVWKFSGPEWYREFNDFIGTLDEGVEWIGHNAISFDIPALVKLARSPIQSSSVIDTLVLSYLYNPALEGGHSLESYGIRLKYPKGGHSDWSKFSPEMLEYCERDVELTAKVYNALRTKMNTLGYSETSCKIEHDIRVIIDEQQRNGFWFDYEGATSLLLDLRRKQTALADQIQKLFPPVLTPIKEYTFRRTKDGSVTASYQNHISKYPAVRLNDDETKYTVFDYKAFNIGSPKQRVEKVLSLGFVPTKFTPKTPNGGGGSPQIDEESLKEFAAIKDIPEIMAIADWLVLQGRCTMIEGWLKHYNEKDGCIHGTIFTCGATTRRMRHRAPNTANIPSDSNKAAYGHECRALWGTRDAINRRLVGYDASGLEMRGFCHYLNDPEAARLYIEGDPHQFNADRLTEALDFQVIRGGGGAKTLFYAFLYGSGDEKLGKILGLSGKEAKRVGKLVRKVLVKYTPGLDRLVSEIQSEFNQTGGILQTIDGGFVRCPSEHAALNYKIQSAGGIVMKQASIFLDAEIKRNEWDALRVGDIHDEGQLDTSVWGVDGDGKEWSAVGEAGVSSIIKAGEYLHFNVPLNGDYKIGLNWGETH